MNFFNKSIELTFRQLKSFNFETDMYEWYPTKYEGYRIEKSRFGLYTSIDIKDEKMVTALTKDACKKATEDIHLPVRHNDFTGYTSIPRQGEVDGKL